MNGMMNKRVFAPQNRNEEIGMKSKSMSAKWARVMLAGLLLGAGLAQAAGTPPVCAPTYSINPAIPATAIASAVAESVTLAANCTPDKGKSINFQTGYAWTWDGGGAVTPVTGTLTSGIITQTPAQANGKTYSVKAKNVGVGEALSVNAGTVTVFVDAPVACDLKVQQADGTLSSTTPAAPATISRGAPATLVPTCVGADTLEWYSKVGANPDFHMLPPPGGVVFPLAATTTYYVVGSNDYGDTASNTVTINTESALAGCAISPASANKTVNATAQMFTAVCSGTTAATTYAWTITGGAGGAGSSYTTAANLASNTYTVGLTASNAGGSSSSASATLTVSNVAAPSGCSISPTSASKTTGGNTSQLFTASCTSGAPSSYAWTIDGNAVANNATSSYTYTTAVDLQQGPHTVSFVASNAGGIDTTVPASAKTATLTVSNVAPPSGCAISPALASKITGGDTSQLFTASCSSGSPSSYAWTIDGVAVQNNATSSYTTSASLAEGPHDVSFVASNAGGADTTVPASARTATLTVAPAPASGGSCAAQGLTVRTDLTAMNWGAGTNKSNLIIRPNDVYVLSFSPNNSGSIKTIYSNSFKLITISDTPCGAPVGGQATCRVQQNSVTRNPEGGPAYSPTAAAGACVLPPGPTYYVNIRNSVPNSNPIQSSCTTATGCSFWLTY